MGRCLPNNIWVQRQTADVGVYVREETVSPTDSDVVTDCAAKDRWLTWG